MTWREKTVARILLILAKMLTSDGPIRDEIKTLATHIAAAPEPTTDEAVP